MAQLGATEIYEGESVDYYVREQNVKHPSPPDMTPFATDFGVEAAGDRSENSSSVTIINGRMTQRNTYGHLYGYRLTPKRAGVLTVPAPVVIMEGQKITGRPLTLNVIAPEKQDLVLMEIVPNKKKVYPTQPFDITLRILIKPLPDVKNRDPLIPLRGNSPAIQINWDKVPDGLNASDLKEWLQKLVGQDGFSLNGITLRGNDVFAVFERRQQLAHFNLAAGREVRNGLDGSKVEYFLYELKRSFTAVKTGVYTFGPATLKGHIVDGLAGRKYNTRHLFVVAAPQTVEVHLPSPRPPTFCGAIGAFAVKASASPSALRVGDPLTLTLTVERGHGSGSLELVSAPDLSANTKLAEDFDIIDKSPTGEVKGDSKRFSYGLRPKRPGVSIPPLTVTTFNPETEKYSDTNTEPVNLNVTQAAQLNAGELVGALPAAKTQDIRSRQQGIFQNVNDVTELGDQRVHPFRYIGGAAGMSLAYICLSLFMAQWRRRAGDVAYQRRQHARRDAEQHLKAARAAMRDGKKEDALRAARAGVIGLIADMLNATAAGMTAHETAAALERGGVPAELRALTLNALESVEAMEYGSAAAVETEKLLACINELLPKLHKAMDARK